MKIGTIELTTTSEELKEIKAALESRKDTRFQSPEIIRLQAIILGAYAFARDKDLDFLLAGILIGAELYRRRLEEREK
jgi:hypothetical protein